MLFRYLLFFFLVSAFAAAAQKPIEIMQPGTEFNFKQAADVLTGGTSEIRGKAFYEKRTAIGIRVGQTIYARPGIVVTLYPLTAYLEEYLELKKRNKAGKRLATISPIAASFRIETKVYSGTGDFVFFGLKPGKYYLESLVHFPSGVGGEEVSGIVEITSEGQKVECKLKHIY